MAKRGDYLIVAALDFGTTYSGYAFSFRDDPEKIFTNKSWGEALGFQSYKTPTSVLTNNAGEFVAMGYEAETQYTETLEEEGAGSGLLLFRHFKMLLHKSKDVKLKAVVTSVDGTIMPAVDIFGHAIGFLRRHLLQAIKTKIGRELHETDIFWVITVPAIWSEQSKKFMREAAKKGGCIQGTNSTNMLLALEPEAASLYCRRLNLAGYDTEETISFAPGTKYVVLDCGGGTVDVTAHQQSVDDTVEEILPASGGPWGGMYVDMQFIELLENIIGKDFINRVKMDHPHSWLELMSSFETVKKACREDEASKLRVKIPWGMDNVFPQLMKGKSLKQAIEEFGNPDVAYRNGALVIKQVTARNIYKPAVDAITEHVTDLLKQPKLADCRYILMVGGFSECMLLQDAIRRRFHRNGTRVLVPGETQLAVLKGAVLFGHCPQEIAVRIARRTYGRRSTSPYKPAKHDPTKMYTNDEGKQSCRHIFRVLVTKGEPITVGKEVTHNLTPHSRKAKQTGVSLYCIDDVPNEPVQYTDAPGVVHIGQVYIDVDECTDRRENKLQAIFTFGATEIYVRCIHKASGREVSSAFDFLSHES